MMFEPKDYLNAILVQDASNLSGVVHSLAEIMSRMVTLGWSNDQRESHPITRLYAAKIADLAGLEYDWPGPDYEECKRLAQPKEES